MTIDDAPDDAAEVAPAAVPLRIVTLELCDFRAFPNPITFNLGGKNLLVYGENGAGKSSVYFALRNFFSLKPASASSLKNVFSGRPEGDFSVAVALSDGTPAVTWTSTRHPTRWPVNDARVAEAALRRSFLDYRALLDTNYLHGDRPPNLFEIAVSQLLADFPIVVEGGTLKTISQLWATVQSARPAKHSASLEPVQRACVAFNEGMRTALEAMQPHLDELVRAILGEEVSIRPITFAGVTYHHSWWKRDREIVGLHLVPEVLFHGHQPAAPQTFLNEARLSALGLAMYLAGRLACVPTGGDRLKLLVLDDVLIGLDHDNRTPILRVLRSHFLDWQIVLLTHDRVWFDMARQFFGATDTWTFAEIFADGDGGRATPSVKMPNGDVVREALSECQQNLDANLLQSAATSGRRAFEWALKRFCEKRRVPIAFTMTPKDNDAEALMNGIDVWIALGGVNRQTLEPMFAELRMYRAGVLNPQTHANAPNPSRQEIEAAAAAVRRLLRAASDQSIT